MSSLVRRSSPSEPFTVLQSAINDLFSDMSRSPLSTSWPQLGAIESFQPRIDVAEDDKNVTVSAELPGIDEKDVEVTLSNNVLTIQGTKSNEREEKGRNWYRSERTYGAFARSLEMPCEVDPEKVQAAVQKGVLTVTLAKSASEKSRSRRIPVAKA